MQNKVCAFCSAVAALSFHAALSLAVFSSVFLISVILFNSLESDEAYYCIIPVVWIQFVWLFFPMTFFRWTLLLLSAFAVDRAFKHAKDSVMQLIFGKQKSCFSLFLIKMSFKKKKRKDASSEQILKNLFGRDCNGLLLSPFLSFLFPFEGKHLVPVKIPNLSCFPELIVHEIIF